jgi:guanylate kinase
LQPDFALPQVPREPPLLIVLSGPSGAGKDSVSELLLRWHPLMHRVVTATTRAVRPGEVAGKDYHFISDVDFDKILSTGGFVEHAVVYDRRYGVPRIEIEDPMAAGLDVIARVDVQGAATLKRLFPDAVLIFIAPPSVAEATRRMQERDADPAAEQRRRAEIAATEMEQARDFDHIVTNETGKLEETAMQVLTIIAEEKRRRASSNH